MIEDDFPGKVVPRSAVFWGILLICLMTASLGYPTAGASDGLHDQGSGMFAAQPPSVTEGKDTVRKVLSVLESRNSDRKVLHKATEKLLKLSESELRLISSLCDRVSAFETTASGDIAFGLITAMIVLS